MGYGGMVWYGMYFSALEKTDNQVFGVLSIR